jgi:hypothetical protein
LYVVTEERGSSVLFIAFNKFSILVSFAGNQSEIEKVRAFVEEAAVKVIDEITKQQSF